MKKSLTGTTLFNSICIRCAQYFRPNYQLLPYFSKNSSKNLCLNEVINEQKLVKFSKITQCMNGIRTKCPHLCSILQTPDIIPVTFLQTLSCFLQTRCMSQWAIDKIVSFLLVQRKPRKDLLLFHNKTLRMC